MKNLKEFKALILKYESITLEDIRTAFIECPYVDQIAHLLTGFGSMDTCTLCKAVFTAGAKFPNCASCVYRGDTDTIAYCNSHGNVETYCAIKGAETSQELKLAFKNRAKHMRKILTEKGITYEKP